MKKRFLGLIMCLILVIVVLPSIASAEGEGEDSSPEASYMSVDGQTEENGTFAEMLDKANASGGTVTLLQNVNLGEGESADISGTVTLDLNGCEIANSLKLTTIAKYEYATSITHTITIKSKGMLTLQDSQTDGNIKNGVSVANGGAFIMNSGSISDSEYLRGVTVAVDGAFTMNGGTISNNCCVGPGRHGAGVSNDGTFIMDGGSITGNLCYGYGETYGGGVYNTGSFTLNNGEISSNQLESYSKSYMCAGGGVCIYNNSSFVMTGGKIINNSAIDYDADWDDYRGHGGGVYIEGAAYYGKITSTFQMTGGEISGNTSALSGGGIYISNNARVDISEGSISNNESLTSSGGGISIYNTSISGGSWSSYSPGELHLTNVIITDNTAENFIYNEKDYGSYGGGIATCPTSDTRMYLKDGGAIYGNHSASGELLAQQIKPEYDNLHVLYLSAYMLGGGAYNWTDLDGDPIEANRFVDLASDDFIATNSISADSNEARAADSLAKVYITGNKAVYMGGGIMNNGILEIGTSDASLRVEKQENGLGTASYDFSVSFWTETEGDSTQNPYTNKITYLGSAVDGIKEEEPDESGKVTFTLAKGDYIVFSGLANGVHYMVEETSQGDYETKYTNQEGTLTEGEMTSVVVTNTYPTGDLTITKKIVGKDETEDSEDKFQFELVLKDEDGEPIKKPGLTLKATVKILSWNRVDQGVELRSAGAASRATLTPDYTYSNMTLTFNNDGKATFTLTHGDSITIILPAGTTYEVVETPTEGYTVTLPDNAKGTIQANDKIEVVITNTPADPETPTTPTDPGKPSKPVNPPSLNTEDHVGYIIGYPDGTVRPEGNITRAETVTIFFRMLTEEVRDQYWSQENPYSDVAKTAWYNNAISTLSNLGIVDGYPDGSFRPDASITRAEFTKIAVSFFEYADENFVYDGEFSDVTGSEWYASFVAAADAFGLIEGYPDGTFLPENPIIRAEACTIVNRTLGRAPAADHLLDRAEMITWPDNLESAWYYAQMQEATNSHDYRWTKEAGEDAEQWTEKLEERNWEALEKVWSTSHSAPGGEVVD